MLFLVKTKNNTAEINKYIPTIMHEFIAPKHIKKLHASCLSGIF